MCNYVRVTQEHPDQIAPSWYSRARLNEPQRVNFEHDGCLISGRSWVSTSTPDDLIILIHGGGAHAAWWDHIAPDLTAFGRVLAIDLSGNGDSGWREEYDLNGWAGEVFATAHKFGADKRVHLVGHSVGGLVALLADVRNVDKSTISNPSHARIASVTAIDPPIRLPDDQEMALRLRLAEQPLRVFTNLDEAINRWRPSPDQAVEPYIREHIARESFRRDTDAWIWKFDPKNFRRALPNIPEWPPARTRTLVMRAENGMMPESLTDHFMERLGSLAVIMQLPGTGHHVMLDQPLALIAGLSGWLGAQMVAQ